MNKKIIDKVDKTTLFWYIVITIVIMVIFSKMTLGMNILIGIIVSFIIIYILYYDYVTDYNNEDEIFSQKTKLIHPSPQESLKYSEIIDFLFSIQDFYIYNPPAYEDLCEHIDYFFKLYDEVLKNNKIAGNNYQLLQDHKHIALNSLQSIVFKIPLDTEYDKKLQKSIITLRYLLDNYIDKVYKIYEKELYENGYSNKTLLLNKNITGYYKDTYSNSFDLF